MRHVHCYVYGWISAPRTLSDFFCGMCSAAQRGAGTEAVTGNKDQVHVCCVTSASSVCIPVPGGLAGMAALLGGAAPGSGLGDSWRQHVMFSWWGVYAHLM